jgi:hypothetical protein
MLSVIYITTITEPIAMPLITPRRVGVPIAVAGALALLAACADRVPTSPGGEHVTAPHLSFTAPAARPATIVVCKSGSSASFRATRSASEGTLDPASGEFSLADGECRTVWRATFIPGAPSPKITVSLRELASASGFRLGDIQVAKTQCRTCLPHNPAPDAVIDLATGTVSVIGNDDYGYVITFVNVAAGPNCTRSKGYWKNHAGGDKKTDAVTPLLPVWLGTPGGSKSALVTSAGQARLILSMNYRGGHPSNGITKLYAQLLAAKLNIKNGANGSAVSATITDADSFLATRDQSSWNGLSSAEKQMVLGWMTTLDRYNNGAIGPGHCD